MGDLNDFFAKKDKLKGAKFATLNNIENKLKTMDKRKMRQKIKWDDEWKRYEEKSKDYTGLKIQNTTIYAYENEEGNDAEALCPWKKTEIVKDESSIPDENLENTSQKPESKQQNYKEETHERPKYVPPHLRNNSLKMVKDDEKIEKLDIETENIMFPALPEIINTQKKYTQPENDTKLSKMD